MSDWQLENDFDLKPATERALNEREARLILAKNRIKMGIPYLDVALDGIRRNELLLLGASSGVGKTELASHIAKTNVEAGKRVHFVALEAEDAEIERRIIFKLIAHLYYSDKGRKKNIFLSYRDWVFGNLDHDLVYYETEAKRIFHEKYKLLTTIYRKKDFDVETFTRALMSFKHESDLVIVDHLNYFDYDERQTENVAITKIMKTLRDLVLISGVPIILVAHVRKRDRFSKGMMPGLEDFHGSSNIYKIATQAVILAPATTENPHPTKWPTLMRVAKSRVEGAVKNYVARVTFNSEVNAYESHYEMGYYRDGQETFEVIDNYDLLPRWARPKAGG